MREFVHTKLSCEYSNIHDEWIKYENKLFGKNKHDNDNLMIILSNVNYIINIIFIKIILFYCLINLMIISFTFIFNSIFLF